MVRGEPQLLGLVVVALYRLDQVAPRVNPEVMVLLAHKVKGLEVQAQGLIRLMVVLVVEMVVMLGQVVVALH
jgi:hypothetical protein